MCLFQREGEQGNSSLRWSLPNWPQWLVLLPGLPCGWRVQAPGTRLFKRIFSKMLQPEVRLCLVWAYPWFEFMHKAQKTTRAPRRVPVPLTLCHALSRESSRPRRPAGLRQEPLFRRVPRLFRRVPAFPAEALPLPARAPSWRRGSVSSRRSGRPRARRRRRRRIAAGARGKAVRRGPGAGDAAGGGGRASWGLPASHALPSLQAGSSPPRKRASCSSRSCGR